MNLTTADMTAHLRKHNPAALAAMQSQRSTDFSHIQRGTTAIVSHLRRTSRCQCHMCCGSGKTRLDLRVHERIKSRLTFIVVPSLSLIRQHRDEWERNAKQAFHVMAVCGERDIDRDGSIQSISELEMPTTNDPKALAKFMRQNRKLSAVVFITFQSLHKLAIAQKKHRAPMIDLLVIDEAHHCAGRADAHFALAVNGKRIKSRKRLFQTATPRIITERVKKRARKDGLQVTSMDDKARFGPVAFTFNHAEAVEAGVVAPYTVEVVIVTEKDIHDIIQKNPAVKIQNKTEVSARRLAEAIGLARVVKKYALNQVLTFHASVKDAIAFGDESKPSSFAKIMQAMPSDVVPSDGIQTWSIYGEQPLSDRRDILGQFGQKDSHRKFLASCQIMREGVNLCDADAVCFMVPKTSTESIVQCVGRALRKSGNKVARIILPVLVHDAEVGSPEEVVAKSRFAMIHYTLLMMRAGEGIKTVRDSLDSKRPVPSGTKDTDGDFEGLTINSISLTDQQAAAFKAAIASRVVGLERRINGDPLTERKIVTMADEHHQKSGKWPTQYTSNLWNAINNCLYCGYRGVGPGLTLHMLLVKYGRIDKRNFHKEVRVGDKFGKRKVVKILGVIDRYMRYRVRCECGNVADVSISDLRLTKGCRSCGAKHRKNCPNLQIGDVRRSILLFFEKTGVRPTLSRWLEDIKTAPNLQINFSSLDICLREGRRGLPGGSSLSKLCDQMGLPKRSRGILHAH